MHTCFAACPECRIIDMTLWIRFMFWLQCRNNINAHIPMMALVFNWQGFWSHFIFFLFPLATNLILLLRLTQPLKTLRRVGLCNSNSSKRVCHVKVLRSSQLLCRRQELTFREDIFRSSFLMSLVRISVHITHRRESLMTCLAIDIRLQWPTLLASVFNPEDLRTGYARWPLPLVKTYIIVAYTDIHNHIAGK